MDRALTKRVNQPSYERNAHARKAVMPGMDPVRLTRVIRDADCGNYDDYLTAAAELEERDGQYGPQIAIRRTAVSALELAVFRPAGANARATKAAQELVDSKALKPFISEALDALGKGFAISEIVWTEKHGKWVPTCIKHDQREFLWHDESETWRLRAGSLVGVELGKNKWVVHEPKLRAGIPIRRGLARGAMYLHMLKSMSLAGWAMLMQVFGVPLAVAKLPETELKPGEVAVLRAALAGLGQGVNAIIPSGTEVEVITAASQGSPERMFSALLEYVDRQMSKLVLGQTMTADNGSSHAQATVHNEVRHDIREGDAEDLAWTINEFLVKPYIDFNVGPQQVYPEVYFAQPDSLDLTAWADATAKMVNLGLPVKATEVRTRLGLSDPEEGDEVIGGKAAPVDRRSPSNDPEALTRSRPRFAARRRRPVRQLGTRRSSVDRDAQ